MFFLYFYMPHFNLSLQFPPPPLFPAPRQAARELRALIPGSLPGQVLSTLSADVSDRRAILAAIDAAAAGVGGALDVLVTSAGVSRPGRFEELELDEFERLNRINYLGTVYCVRAALPYLKKQGY